MPIEQNPLNANAQQQQAAAMYRVNEQQLEDLIALNPQVLSDDWMIIGRQERTDSAGRIDLLAIAPDSSLVLIELKRSRTAREIVAQTLEYAAWVERLTPEDVRLIYQRFSKGKVLDDAFKHHFGFDLDVANLNRSHQIAIVASELDDSSERIIAYLNARNIVIKFHFFQVQDRDDAHYAPTVKTMCNEALFALAQKQSGFFTAKQAEAVGFTRTNHPYHVRSGRWVRQGRGIFRLKQFPVAEEADLALWSLWSRDRSDQPTGVYSHETALRIYDLSDVVPAKLHMTVPRSFRRNTQIPSVLVLHRANLQESEVEEGQGYRVTRPIKTLIDLIRAASLPEETLRNAFSNASQKGLITQGEIAQHRSALSGVIKSSRL